MRILILHVTLTLVFAESIAAQSSRNHKVLCGFPEFECNSIEEPFDFQNKTPLDFINYLKVQGRDNARSAFPFVTVFPFVTLRAKHCGWILSTDIPKLRSLLKSTEPSASVVSLYSSFLPVSYSTVGIQAKYMIDSYNSESSCYPHTLHSGPKLDNSDSRH